jgi:DNA-binding IscR family transcriptional regulator
LRREPSDVALSEIIRLIDGPLAPFADAEQLRELIDRDPDHRTLYQIFLDVRDAAARILDNTTLADLVAGKGAASAKTRKRAKSPKKESASILPMVVGGQQGE